tara:strand:- start:8441 stop:8779 length:339 start_codon:yes stop_codon:yes gene_type:complete
MQQKNNTKKPDIKIIKQEYDSDDRGEWIIEYENTYYHVEFEVFGNEIEEAKRRIHPVDLSYDEPAVIEYFVLFTDEVWIVDKSDPDLDLLEVIQLNEKQETDILNFLYEQKV